MNVVTAWSATVPSSPSDAGASKSMRHGDSTEDRYAAWTIVFERARPVDVAQDRHAASQAEREARDPQLSTHASSAPRGRDLLAGAPLHAHVPALPSPIASTFATVGPGAGDPAPTASAHPGRAGISVAPVQTLPLSDRSQPLAQSATVTTNVDLWSTATPRYPSADSVSVFVHGEGVEIVVRDASVSDQQAVHAAFATALDLTGRRGTLRELTLNGRTLYRRQDEPARPPPQQPPALVFAC